jgi:hypothetical protein
MSGPRRFALLLTAALAAAAVVAATVSAAGFDYSYITKGVYKGTAVVPPGPDYITPKFAGGRYPVSFRLTSPSRKAIRFIRSLAIGPIPALCNKPSGVVGKADEYAVRTLPRQSGFPVVTTGGFIIRGFALHGTHWKLLPANRDYSGPLPHVSLGFVFNKNPTRFNPNPVIDPSVSVLWRTDDAGNVAADGPWHCTSQSVMTVKLRG